MPRQFWLRILRALAEVVPFDATTTAIIEAAADYLDEQPGETQKMPM